MNWEVREVDYQFGVKSEDDLYQLLIEKFGELKKSKNKFCKYDYKGDNILIEIKTRRNDKNRYRDTMIGKDKLDFAKLNDKYKTYFIFNFTDGVWFWEYDELEAELVVNFGLGGRKDRGMDEIKEYAYIPNNILTKL